MNTKAVIVMGVALILGATTAVLVSRLLKQQAELSALGQTQQVVVAAAPISVGQQISAEMVKTEEWPKKILPEGVFRDVSRVVNRVSLAEVVVGEALVAARLAAEGSAAGLSAVIPPGMRAMTVKVDEVIGVAGFVSPGSYVDVVATAIRMGTEGESTSRVILQHVKVLASGKQVETKDGGPVEVRTVTLEVNLEQAEALALASNAGKLQLVMRNSVDVEEVPTGGMNTAVLFEGPSLVPRVQPATTTPPSAKSRVVVQKGPPVEAPPEPKTVTVELLRGVEKTTVTFQ